MNDRMSYVIICMPMKVKEALYEGDILALAVVIIWGSYFSIAKIALEQIHPLAFVEIRFIATSLLLISILLLRGEKPTVGLNDLPRIVVAGVAGFGVGHMLRHIGISLTMVANASVLGNAQPIFTMMLAPLLREERLTWRAASGILLSFIGVYFVVTGAGQSMSFAKENLVGDLLCLTASCMGALGMVVSKPVLNRHSSLQVVMVAMLCAALSMLPLTYQSIFEQQWATVSLGGWLGLAYGILLAAGVGLPLWYKAVGNLGPTRTAIYSYLVPVVGIIIAVLSLREEFTVLQGCGVIAVLAGMIVARL